MIDSDIVKMDGFPTCLHCTSNFSAGRHSMDKIVLWSKEGTVLKFSQVPN